MKRYYKSCNQKIYLRLVVVIVLAGFSYLAVFELTDNCFKKDATYILNFGLQILILPLISNPRGTVFLDYDLR